MGWQDASLVGEGEEKPAAVSKGKGWRSAPRSGGTSLVSEAKGLRMEAGAAGRRIRRPVDRDYPALPFIDRTVAASLDKDEERVAYYEQKYGKGSVSKDKKGYVVTVNGKKMRAGSGGMVEEAVASSPELVLGGVGAAAGAPAGPVGSIAGAGAGMAAGKSIKEAAKSAAGLQRQSPGEIVESVGSSGVAGAAGEGAGKALGLVRKIPGRSILFSTTPETKAMTGKLLDAGARPPPQSTVPSGRKLQRIVILADKLVGRSKTIDRANLGYLQDQASDILTKAGVGGAAKDETMRRLTTEQGQPAMSFQDTGKMIQNSARYMMSNEKGKNLAYLKQVSAIGRTPEQAYAWLTAPGETDRLERFVRIMGKNSAVVQAVQQRALRHVLAGAMDRAESGEAVGALEKELSQYTAKQQKLLFPGGIADDMRVLGREIQFLFPKIKDPAMAGFKAGSIMEHVWYERFYAQGYYSFMRAMIQNPAIMRRIAIGLSDTKTRQVTRTAIKEMFYFGANEMAKPEESPDESTGTGQRR